MNLTNSSNNIDLDEELGRCVFSSKEKKYAILDGIPKSVFLERQGVSILSVDRLSKAPQLKAIEIAEDRTKKRVRNFYGWAVIYTKNASRDNRKVLASPTKENPYHADIVLPLTTERDREEQESHAQQLADASSWRGKDTWISNNSPN